MPTAIVDTQTNEFEPFGHAQDARWVRVTLSRNPDCATEKFNGNLGSPAIVAKTAPEIAATATAREDVTASAELHRAILASMATLFKAQTGSFPTPAQRAALKTDFVTVWKALAP